MKKLKVIVIAIVCVALVVTGLLLTGGISKKVEEPTSDTEIIITIGTDTEDTEEISETETETEEEVVTTTTIATTTTTTTVATTTAPTVTTTPVVTTTTQAPVVETSNVYYSNSTFKRMGVFNYNGHRWTWYSEKVLPGPGLRIPGRHVDENGYVCDENDYICLAANFLSKGTVVDTPLGKQGKIYDYCETNNTIDVYVSW